MKLKFCYPAGFYIRGNSEAELTPETSFLDGELNVHIKFEIDKPVKISADDDAYLASVEKIHFEIDLLSEESRQTKEIQELVVNSDKHPKLIKILAGIINRTLKAIRNFGLVPHIQDIFVHTVVRLF